MLLQTIEQIGREKNIEPKIIIEAIEEAMAVAAQKFYRTDDYLEASLNRQSGEVELYAVKSVVAEVEDATQEMTVEQAIEAGMDDPQIGDQMRTSMPTDQLGRIAAQAAKQVIYQKVRDAERDNTYNEFIERTGELLTGIVKRFERGDMVVDLGTTEGILPRREQSRAEHYNIGDRIRVVIIEVLRATRGPQVIVSRASPELLRRLFEMEVPEIYDKTVVVKGVVREGGDRAKVAVHSQDPAIDPVGACVGMRGSRVQSIIRELRGEKIDIVEWAPETKQFAINALKPARVNKVNEIVAQREDGEPENRLEVIVNDDQLSLAIGKRGQNVRLAGKLLGCKIDVKGAGDRVEPIESAVVPRQDDEQSADVGGAADPGVDAAVSAEPAEADTTPLEVEGLEELQGKVAAALRAAGFRSAASIVDAGEDSLLAVVGIGPKTAIKVFDAATAAVQAAAAAKAAEARAAAATDDDD